MKCLKKIIKKSKKNMKKKIWLGFDKADQRTIQLKTTFSKL